MTVTASHSAVIRDRHREREECNAIMGVCGAAHLFTSPACRFLHHSPGQDGADIPGGDIAAASQVTQVPSSAKKTTWSFI